MGTHTWHPRESKLWLPVVFSLEGIVTLSKQTGSSFLQLLQEQTGYELPDRHSRPLFPHLPPATWAPRAGVRMEFPKETPVMLPFRCGAMDLVTLQGGYLGQAVSRRSEWLPARNLLKNPAFRGPASGISPQP